MENVYDLGCKKKKKEKEKRQRMWFKVLEVYRIRIGIRKVEKSFGGRVGFSVAFEVTS